MFNLIGKSLYMGRIMKNCAIFAMLFSHENIKKSLICHIALVLLSTTGQPLCASRGIFIMESVKNVNIGTTTYILGIDGSLYNTKRKKYKKWTKDNYGYMRTQLWSGNKATNVSQHRLLAQHFIKNEHNKSQVNHINAIKHDNRIENLEWVTPQENTIHSYVMGLQKNMGPTKKIIDIEKNIIYSSIKEACLKNGLTRPILSKILNGRKLNNLSFRYYEEE
jgi:hypothetical protein